ncbi:MAG: hypothetical protein JXR41_13700 [Bacteroidales bacterium]|nr:hypothetical protein [Bacteroidales bacterium]MBN2764141.1 hypothetical protein [Bacteroidales bacterium]
MKTLKIILTITIILTGGSLFSQETTYKRFPVHVSFVYPVGIHGVQSVSYTYDFSLNILTGHTGNIDGCAIGSLININQGYISGCQLAGIGNITGGDVDGLQVGGIFSMADNLDGVQISGIFNKCAEAEGLQLAGILNTSASSDAAIAGIANINAGDQQGIQLAGILNQAKAVNGVQIGLVNIADTINKGIPIGLVSIVRNGFYDEFVFSVADYQNLGVSYKLGIKQFYTIYSVGMNLFEDQLWVAGLGFGHLHEVTPKFSVQPEIICYTYYPMDFVRRIRDTYIGHFKLGIVKSLSETIAVSVAPSVYLSLKSNRGSYSVYGYEQSLLDPLFDINPASSNSRFGFGFGLSLGLHFR